MFDFIRKHTKITMGLLFLLIVPSFILFGLDGYNRDRQKGVAVAKIDGKEIIQSEWDQAHQREAERLRASMPSLDPKLLDSPEARYATLERLVRDRVLTAAADKFKLSTSVIGSGFSPAAAADMALNAYFEKREIQVARFAVADYAAKLSPSDADLEQYYKSNEKLFQAPEQANIEYVLLDVDGIKKGITVNDADLKAYYDQNAARLSGTEERRASHILIASPPSAPAADRQKARAKAEELLALVKKSPDSFADVARKNSQDPGSAPNGGDLDFFARKAMVKPFEDAAFSMKKGDISDVIESEFGYHIIKLTDIKAPKQRSFEEMKAELEADVKKQQAQKKFSETAEAFSNGVYEQADNLKGIADRLKLEVRTQAGVTRTPPPGASGPLANPKFLNAIFSPDAIEKKRNTEAVEVASNQLISGRIVQYTPARTLPLAEVKDNVRQRWLAARGADEARKDGAAKLVIWKAAPDSAVLPPAVLVSRDQLQNLPARVVDAALKTDASKLPAFAGVDLGPQGYAILKVVKVTPREAPQEAALKQDRNQYAQWWSSAESLAYYNVLKQRFKTEILVAKPEPVKADAPTVTQ
jgi:peptidyl-prolyl cis-trans isomerase D